MIRKYILSAIIFLATVTSVYAVEIKDVDPNANVTVSGQHTVSKNAGETVQILLVKKGADPEKALTQSGQDDIIYYGEVLTQQDGKYEKIFKLGSKVESGEYELYAGDNGGIVKADNNLTYTLFDEKIHMLKEIITAEENNIAEKIALYQTALGYDVYKPFTECCDVKTGLVSDDFISKLYEGIDDKWLEILDGTDQEGQTEVINAFYELIKEISVLECYNSGKGEIFFKSDYIFEYDDITNISGLDKDGVTVYGYYLNKISNDGKEKIRNELLNKNFSNLEELKIRFAKMVILYGIKYPETSGTGYISEIITEENSNAAKYNFSDYYSLANKGNANVLIVSNKNSITETNIEEKIKEYSVLDNKQHSSNSSGSSGGSGIKDFTVPYHGNNSSIENKPVEPDDNKVSKYFNDMDNTEWAAEAIDYLYEKNIIDGMGNEVFAPHEKLTREQAVKIVCLAFDSEGGSVGISFNDVKKDQWYYNYIEEAYGRGIITGISANEFGIERDITREDFAVMLYRCMETEKTGDVRKFVDYEQIAEYAIDAVGYLSDMKAINGYEDNSFRPKNTITRAEASQLIYNILKDLEEQQ